MATPLSSMVEQSLILYVCDNKVFRECELDFLNLGNSAIDWEQRRYEIAKECVAALMTNEITLEDAAKISVEQADILIEKLKGE
jgi:hypothetical protein